LIARKENNVQGAEDVFDPSCYGEEEFGPEEEVAKKAKPTRKKREAKKKETKAIIGQHLKQTFFSSISAGCGSMTFWGGSGSGSGSADPCL
jgi:hypothetical protein